ncbi:unnamed protein product, partial [Prorocentrum cordatum]
MHVRGRLPFPERCAKGARPCVEPNDMWFSGWKSCVRTTLSKRHDFSLRIELIVAMMCEAGTERDPGSPLAVRFSRKQSCTSTSSSAALPQQRPTCEASVAAAATAAGRRGMWLGGLSGARLAPGAALNSQLALGTERL